MTHPRYVDGDPVLLGDKVHINYPKGRDAEGEVREVLARDPLTHLGATAALRFQDDIVFYCVGPDTPLERVV